MDYKFIPHGVCSREIDIELDGDIIKNVKFHGGCEGNLKAISKLIKDQDAHKIIELLEGNTCGFKKHRVLISLQRVFAWPSEKITNKKNKKR